MSDYMELGLDYVNRDHPVDLWITTRKGQVVKFHHVIFDPIRDARFWVIAHRQDDTDATSMFPADEAWFFTVVEREPSCERCGHSSPHTGGGIGVCGASGCGCDGPVSDTVDWGVKA